MSVIGLIPCSLAQGHLSITNKKKSFAHCLAHYHTLALLSGSGFLSRASLSHIPHALYSALNQPLTSTSPSPISLELSWSPNYHRLPHPSQSVPIVQISFTVVHYHSLSHPPTHPYLSLLPWMSLMRIRGLSGMFFACPCAPHSCNCNSPLVCYHLITYTRHLS